MQKQLDELDMFVNSNSANYYAKPGSSFESGADEFSKHVLYDTESTIAWPVLVYAHNNKYVAWYDCELMCGYIASN